MIFRFHSSCRRDPFRLWRHRAWLSSVVVWGLLGVGSAMGEPFAAYVIRYDPAPGRFVNDAAFNDPQDALGPPNGGGIAGPDNSSLVSLGALGGAITLGFDHPVEDDPRNPFGMDAIVFGNSFWAGGDPDRRWAECATIEISFDENANGEADDPWYLIPGSHIPDPSLQWLEVTWDDDILDGTFPPSESGTIPPGLFGQWTTSAFSLPLELFGTLVVVNPAEDISVEGIFGYADYSPTLVLGDLDADDIVDDTSMTPEAFYTLPDDPRTVGISSGSGGGDAFDIAWAIDPDTGLPADLAAFHFIRITSAVNAWSEVFGENSAEIDAVADAAPDPFGDADGDGDIDLRDVAALQRCFDRVREAPPGCDRLDLEPDGFVDDTDAGALLNRIVGPIGSNQ